MIVVRLYVCGVLSAKCNAVSTVYALCSCASSHTILYCLLSLLDSTAERLQIPMIEMSKCCLYV